MRILLSAAAVAIVLVAVVAARPMVAADRTATNGSLSAPAGFQMVSSAASSVTGGTDDLSSSTGTAVAPGPAPRHTLALSPWPAAAHSPTVARQPPQGVASPADLQSSGGFAGLGHCTIVPTTCTEPPDPWVAVNGSDVVQAVNLAIRVSTRSGTTLKTTTFPTFFAELGGQQGDSDPHVVWDAPHGRWLATELSWDCAAGHVYLAVS
ncbi:MAG TPA: hypothetical protein VID25_04005, partial [Candidatus Limnocylindrales bacterium]